MKPTDNYNNNICISDSNPIYAKFKIIDNSVLDAKSKLDIVPDTSKDLWKVKYLKYKTKYLKLKNQLGGNNLFDIFTISPDRILYHGNQNNVQGNLFNPAFFSEDIMQSLGHILIWYREFADKNLCNINRNVIENKIINFLQNKCYPLIHIYKSTRELKFLKINNPQISQNSFGKIYNIPILQKYIFNLEKEKRNRILSIHITKMLNLNLAIKYPKLNEGVYKGDDETKINTNITELLTIYNKVCRSCFKSWYNTPGYYLLSEIDYNRYFKEIGLIKETEHIDGIYVEVDQDEIVLFDTSLVKKEDTLFILPYSLMDIPLIEKQEFIKKYIDLTKTVSQTYRNAEYIKPNL